MGCGPLGVYWHQRQGYVGWDIYPHHRGQLISD